MGNNVIIIRGLYAWSLTLLFIGLKLSDQIDWNWLFVLMPAIIRVAWLQWLTYMMGRANKKANQEESDVEVQVESHSSNGTYL